MLFKNLKIGQVFKFSDGKKNHIAKKIKPITVQPDKLLQEFVVDPYKVNAFSMPRTTWLLDDNLPVELMNK